MSRVRSLLAIERELHKQSVATGSERFNRYERLKEGMLSLEYIFTLHGFRGGNDHGPKHILRVLEYTDKLLQRQAKSLTELELYLLLCSVLLHDLGLLRGRNNHARQSQRILTTSPDFLAHFEPQEINFLGRIVKVHSSREDIETEFKGYREKEDFSGDTIRLRHIAALLRLADALDEDTRRAQYRVFQKIQLPEESVIYWRINRSISAVSVEPSQHVVRVTAEYSPIELGELHSYGDDKRINVVAGVMRKVQAINAERRYCMRFIDEKPRLRKVELLLRDRDSNETTEIILDDAEDGEKYFSANPMFFHEEKATSHSSAPVREASSWNDLSKEESSRFPLRVSDFIRDAEEIRSRPDLFGPSELIVVGPPEDGLVKLRFDLFADLNTIEPIRVEVYPVGKYPSVVPRVEICEADRRRAGFRLHEWLGRVCVQEEWNQHYRGCRKRRLFHIADRITDRQNHRAVFRYHASQVPEETNKRWRYVQPDTARARLERACSSAGNHFCLTVEPSAQYPRTPPEVRCSPVPRTSVWLGTGELNWPHVRSNHQFGTWTDALRERNPLLALVRLIDRAVPRIFGA